MSARPDEIDQLKQIVEESIHAEALEIERRLIERIERAEATINGLVAAYGILGRLPVSVVDDRAPAGEASPG